MLNIKALFGILSDKMVQEMYILCKRRLNELADLAAVNIELIPSERQLDLDQRAKESIKAVMARSKVNARVAFAAIKADRQKRSVEGIVENIISSIGLKKIGETHDLLEP